QPRGSGSRRIGPEGKSPGHFAIDDVLLCAARSMFPLHRQDMEVVTAIGSRSAASSGLVALRDRVRNQRSDGTLGFAGAHLPIKTVVLPFIAEGGLRIPRVLRVVVFVLRRGELLANANGRHFITAHSPIQDFLLARVGVEIPAMSIVDERYGRRPVPGPDVKN